MYTICIENKVVGAMGAAVLDDKCIARGPEIVSKQYYGELT